MTKKSSRRQHPPMSQVYSELPDAEAEVLACLWKHGPSTAAQIRDYLHAYRPMAHGSVLTLLKRLSDKSLVAREKVLPARSYVFRSAHQPQAAWRAMLSRLTERIFGGDPVALVASLLESRMPTMDELQEIKALLTKAQKEQPNAKR